MPKRTKLTMRQIRKLNAFLKSCADLCESDELRNLILSHTIRVGKDKLGQVVNKG